MLSARNDRKGAAIDWWFMYKLPEGVGPAGRTNGNEYLYYDPHENKPLQLSPCTLGTGRNGALYRTMRQFFPKPGPKTGWIFYNDEYPDDMSPYDPSRKDPKQAAKVKARLVADWEKGKSDWPPAVKPAIASDTARQSDRGMPTNHSTNGHNKGVLAFDLATDTAFWLSHSTPKIPALHTPAGRRFYYPEYTWKYAQTFICITLDGVATASDRSSVECPARTPGLRVPSAEGSHPEIGEVVPALATGTG